MAFLNQMAFENGTGFILRNPSAVCKGTLYGSFCCEQRCKRAEVIARPGGVFARGPAAEVVSGDQEFLRC